MNQEKHLLKLRVRGMTCLTCEKRIISAVSAAHGVLSVEASQAHGRVTVTFGAAGFDRERAISEVTGLINKAGYVVTGHARGDDQPPLATVLVIAAVMIGVFLLINSQGWFNFLPSIDSSVGLGMIFIAGLLTSVHCVAMCGGIALSQQAKQTGREAEVPEVVAALRIAAPDAAGSAGGRLRASLRGLQYHFGRIVSYTVLGGIVGALGSVISFSPVTKGILAGIAGLFMVAIGLRMLGLLPWLAKLRLPRMSRLIGPQFRAALSRRGPFFVGLLNGFMPCGPLQTMQLYALGTGNAVLGALSMLLFSAGTVPLMFAFGALSSFFTPRWQTRLVRASAVLVVFFGVVMAGRALDLSGASGVLQTAAIGITGGVNSAAGTSSTDLPGGAGAGGLYGDSTVAKVSNDVQLVGFDLRSRSYTPITVQKGIPVKWTINVDAANLNGCNNEISIPQYNLRKKLLVGANIIEFTPEDTGIVSYTCWMGMISSSIRVVEQLDVDSGAYTLPQVTEEGDGQAAGGSCCAAGSATAFANGAIPSDVIQKAEFLVERGEEIQEVVVTVDGQGYAPAVFVVQKGVAARFRFVAEEINSCNQYVDFPDFGGGLDLGGGQSRTPLLPVYRDFVFQCGMGMLHGYVRVVDDLKKADLSEIRATVEAWKPAGGVGGGCH